MSQPPPTSGQSPVTTAAPPGVVVSSTPASVGSTPAQSAAVLATSPQLAAPAVALPSTTPQPLEITVAHIGLIGALIGALIVAILGSGVAGIFALKNTTNQLAGETEKSKAEFLRGQRQVLYSKVAADENALVQKETDYYIAITTADGTWQQRVSLAGGPYLQAVSTYDADQFSVKMIGSDEVVTAFYALSTEHTNQERNLITMRGDRAANPTATVDTSQYVATESAVSADETALSSAARNDMGIK